MSDRGLRAFSDDTDTFLAFDRADLREAWKEYTGAKSDGDMEAFDEVEWEELPPRKLLTIWCDAAGKPDEPHAAGNAKVTKTAAEWAATVPRGLLCSTEY